MVKIVWAATQFSVTLCKGKLQKLLKKLQQEIIQTLSRGICAPS